MSSMIRTNTRQCSPAYMRHDWIVERQKNGRPVMVRCRNCDQVASGSRICVQLLELPSLEQRSERLGMTPPDSPKLFPASLERVKKKEKDLR